MTLNDLDKSSLNGVVIVDPPRNGESNMAIDDSLIARAQPDWPIVLRVYRWDQPTLSLGHFQNLDDRADTPALNDLPWVRRKTGGGAILHDQELTYSILIPNRQGLATKGHSDNLYRAIHSAFVNELRSWGWDAKLSESCTCHNPPNSKAEPFLCFSRRSPVDLIIGEAKILGSAQRRTSSGLIQHGSLLLRSTSATPNLLGLLEQPRSLDGSDFCRPTSEEFVQIFGNDFRACDVRDKLRSSNLLEWMVGVLKGGLSSLFGVTWKTGKLNEFGLDYS